jgi:hypothetical protein
VLRRRSDVKLKTIGKELARKEIIALVKEGACANKRGCPSKRKFYFSLYYEEKKKYFSSESIVCQSNDRHVP